MNRIDISRKRIHGGYFTIKPDPKRPFSWPTNTGKNEHFVGTYRNSGSPLRDTLIDLLRSAKESIFITSFLIGDESVIDEIILAAERLHGGVYVITALDEQSLRRGLEEYDGRDELDSPEEQRKNFARLTSRGVYVRGHESCHAKFALADGDIALVGSANFVEKGFEWTGEANVVIRSSKEVSRLKRLFTQLWYEGCSFEIPPGVTYKVEQRTPGTSPIPLPEETIAAGSLVWTNGPKATSLLACIKDVINSSRESLMLSSYSIVGMQDNPELLFDDIVSARKRGVNVSLFVRQRNAFPRQCDDLAFLYEHGVHIFADIPNHAKVVIADDRDAAVFSANFDANHGLNGGVEVGYRLADADAIGHLKAYMDHAVKYANAEYRHNPMLSELDGKLAARWCSAWQFESEIEVAGAGHTLDFLKSQDIISPVLYEQKKTGGISIWCDDQEITGENVNGKFRGELTKTPCSISSSALFKTWLQSARGNTESDFARRGIFSGSIVLR